MMRLTALSAVAATTVAATAAASEAWQFSRTNPATTYNFMAIGDWGDDSKGQAAAAAG